MLFGFQLPKEVRPLGDEFREAHLFHADGTEVCAATEPEATRPAALWPAAGASVPTVPGDPDYRRHLAEARLRLGVSAEEERGSGTAFGVAVLMLFLLLALMVVGCGWYVVEHWPVGKY